MDVLGSSMNGSWSGGLCSQCHLTSFTNSFHNLHTAVYISIQVTFAFYFLLFTFRLCLREPKEGRNGEGREGEGREGEGGESRENEKGQRERET